MITSWQKSQKLGNQRPAFKVLMRELDINIIGKQAHWIKCTTWSYKKIKKKKILLKVEDFKMHHW